MTELDALRYENYALKDRLQTLDISLGAFHWAAERSVATLRALAERMSEDTAAVEALSECASLWSDMLDEIIKRSRSFAPLAGAPSAN